MTIKLHTNLKMVKQLQGSLASSVTGVGVITLSRLTAETLIADAIHAHEFDALVNNPHTSDFLEAVKLEAAHQRDRWGEAHDRGKSAENWFWLVGYLAGKCLRACVTGDEDKALHHTISAAAALANWFEAIHRDTTGAGLGDDADIKPIEIARFENPEQGEVRPC